MIDSMPTNSSSLLTLSRCNPLRSDKHDMREVCQSRIPRLLCGILSPGALVVDQGLLTRASVE